MTDEMGRLLDGLFARGQREGTIRDDLPPNMLSIMWGGMLSMSGALLEGAPPDEVADVVVRMILGPPAPEAAGRLAAQRDGLELEGRHALQALDALGDLLGR